MHNKLIEFLLNLERRDKSLLVMMMDYLMLVLAFWSSLSIRINSIYIPSIDTSYLIVFAPLIALPVFYFFGLYKSLIRYSNYVSLFLIFGATSVYTILWFLIVIASSIVEKPFDFLIINFLLCNLFTGGIRYLARWTLIYKYQDYSSVLIYGAGAGGIQIKSALAYSGDVRVKGFVDDDEKIQGSLIDGLWVFSPSNLENIIKQKDISEVILAMPSLSRSKIKAIIEKLKKYSIKIRVMPSVSEIAKGNISISDLKTVKIEDLLNREIRKPIEELINKDIISKSILVTGAGGSIGSEICRQIIKLQPKKIVLFDISEVSLYQIERELNENAMCPIITVIGNVTNQTRLSSVIARNKIDTVYHAAAYKHVPMVEKNIFAGIRCNIFGTLSCVRASIKNNVESFVFISTDKAVRPTNIMGATKRFAEIILQGISKDNKTIGENKTRISMVRFGNVLGSSGSVVPLFREQIEKGGPITVTDPNIIRYFMTTEEAAQLVIQAGAMGKTGDIFVLDMGEQVQVLDLAKDMIRLSGMSIADENNSEGDIEIVFTGLREGEKLFEELLIDGKTKETEHEKIEKVEDKHLSWDEVKTYLSQLETAIRDEDYDKCKEVFSMTVSGYIPSESGYIPSDV